MHRYGLLILLFAFLSVQLWSQTNPRTPKNAGPASSAQSLSNKSSVPAGDQAKNRTPNQMVYQRTVDALQVRRQYIDPVLKKHWQKPIQCKTIVDDEKAFTELEHMKKNAVGVSTLGDFSTKDLNEWEAISKISPELERQIQEKSKGKMVIGHPTASTIEIWADFWEKYSCTDSGLIALFKIMRLLNDQTSLAVVIQQDGTKIYFFEDFTKKLGDYILANYPECWETQLIKRGKATYNNGRDSLARAAAWQQWIDYEEAHDVYIIINIISIIQIHHQKVTF